MVDIGLRHRDRGGFLAHLRLRLPHLGSGGIGFSSVPVRFGAPPEVTLIRLRSIPRRAPV